MSLDCRLCENMESECGGKEIEKREDAELCFFSMDQVRSLNFCLFNFKTHIPAKSLFCAKEDQIIAL